MTMRKTYTLYVYIIFPHSIGIIFVPWQTPGSFPHTYSAWHISEYDGLKIYCGKKSIIFLTGTEIDYEESLMSSGFTFKTPYASKSCGCGESVAFDMEKVQQNGKTK